MIRCAEYLLAALHVLLVRFADLNYFVSQLSDAFFDGTLHDDRLLQLRVLCFGFSQDGDVGVGVFPEGEITAAAPSGAAGRHLSGPPQMRGSSSTARESSSRIPPAPHTSGDAHR